MELLFNQVNFGDGYPGMRNRLILEMFYSTGMRLTELVNLKETDVDFHHGTLMVLGKRNKERLIPFSKKFESMLESYMHEKRNFFGDAGYLFLTDKGRRIYSKMVYRIVIQYLGE